MFPASTPPGAVTGTAISLTCRYSPLAFLLGLLTPMVSVDGQPVRAGWHRTVIPVPPGPHHVHVHVPYLLPARVGPADLTVTVAYGQVVDLEYRAPVFAFAPGSLGPPPQRYRGVPALAAVLGASLALALLVCVGGAVLLSRRDGSAPRGLPTAWPHPSARPSASAAVGPALTPSGATTPDPGGSDQGGSDRGADGEPTINPAAPTRRVVGDTYAATDQTYTMAFPGWPFAFRTPGTWGCLGGRVDLPDSDAVVCVDQSNPFEPNSTHVPKPDQSARIVLRTCPGSCGDAKRRRLEREWLDLIGAENPRRLDERTAWREGRDDKGRYELSMSHFFAADGTHWQVGVVVTALPDDRGDVQPIVNDILSQTS